MPNRLTPLQRGQVRILFIPFVYTKGSERVSQLIKIMSRHYDVVGLKPKRRGRQTYRGRKAVYVTEYLLEKIVLILKGIRIGLQNHVNLIFCEEPEYALPGLIISKILRKPVIYDSHGNRYLLCMRLNPPFYYRLYIRSLDTMLAKMCSLLLVVSEHNKRYYVYQGVPPESIRILPSCIDLNEVDNAREGSLKYLKLFKGKKTLLFLGNFAYQPNVEALRFINNELAPAIEHKDNVDIYISGYSSVPIQRLTGCILHRKVTYLGFVPNVYEVLHAADAFVCPLWSTVGIIVKMLDAMAVGKPIVTTSLLKEGIPELNECNVLLARDKSEFIRLVVDLLEHYDKYAYMGSSLHRIIVTKYSEEIVEKQLCSVIYDIVSR